jgi:hypothetical protein
MSDYKLYSFSDVIKKSGIVKPWKTRLYIEEKVSVKPVCGDCCLRTNETINELQLNAELTIQESYELKRRLSNIEREKMNIDDKLKVFLNDWTSWRMKTHR